MMQYAITILRVVGASYIAYSVFLFWYRWFVARGVRKLQEQRTQTVAITPIITAVSSVSEVAEPLEETWSNEKVEAWRVIDVTVEEGDDGLWLGFPHPDGPTDDVVTPVRHPVGVELHAECKTGQNRKPLPDCHTIPGEWCASGYGAGCGFYAFKTRGAAVTHIVALRFSPSNHGSQAIAKVLLSGKVIEHEGGYRAEILEVVSVEPVQYPGVFFSFEEATAAIMGLAPGWGMSTPIPPQNLFINLGGNS